MTIYTFTHRTDGQTWGTPWTRVLHNSAVMDVQGGIGRLLATRNGGLDANAWAYTVPAQADVDFAVAFSVAETSADDGFTPFFGVRCSIPGAGLPSNGYILQLRHDGTGLVRLLRRRGIAEVPEVVLATFDPGDVADGEDWVARMRVHTVGSAVQIRARILPEGSFEEDWHISYDDVSDDRLTANGGATLGSMITAGTDGEYLDVRVREAQVENPNVFDYSAPNLSAVLDDSDYSVDLSWDGSPIDVDIQREVWTGKGEPWL